MYMQYALMSMPQHPNSTSASVAVLSTGVPASDLAAGHTVARGESPIGLATAGRFVLQAAIWGSSFALIQVALRDMSAAVLVLVRVAMGAAILTLIARARGARLTTGVRTWGHVAIAAVLGNVAPYLLLAYGEEHAAAALAGVLVGGTPLLTVLAAAALLPEERTNARQVTGYVVGFAGVILVLEPWGTSSGPVWARLACLGAAASYALGYVYVRRFLSTTTVSPMGMAAPQLIAATAIQAVATPLLGWHVGQLHLHSMLCVAILGLLGTGYATVLYFRLIADIGPSAAASVDYLVPVFAVVFAVVLLGESLRLNMLAGGAVVLVGVALVEGRLALLISRHWSARRGS